MAGTIAAVVTIAKIMAAGDFGYSQTDRWSGLRGGRLHQPGNFDCSSSTAAAVALAGYPINLNGTLYTGDGTAKSPGYIAAKLKAAGFRLVNARGKSLAWLKKNVTAGAALVGPGHVVLGIGVGKVLSFEASELGTLHGKAGDQTGREGRIRDVYTRSRGWATLCLPPVEKAVKYPPVLRNGSKGRWVEVLQRELNRQRKAGLTVDGRFGPKTVAAVKQLEKAKKLTVNGVVGPSAWKALGVTA